jgi:hypothetical protein
MKGQVGIIIGIVIVIIFGVLAMWFLASVLELLKIVAILIAAPFAFLWFWMFFTRKPIQLDKFIGGCLSLAITISLIAFLYFSWWAIIGFGICILVLWVIYRAVMNIPFMDMLKDLTGTYFKRGKKR